MRRRRLVATGFGVMAAIALAVLGGAAATGLAAKPTHSVSAELVCEPPAVKPGRTVGCTLTVTNTGANTVVKVVAAEQVLGGTFLSSSSSLCTTPEPPTAPDTLTCNIGKLTSAGTVGPSSFTVDFELRAPSTSFDLEFVGFFDPEPLQNPNKRGNDTFSSFPVVPIEVDPSADFDGTFVNAAGELVRTDTAISVDNPYTTTGTVHGAPAFAAGLSVREESAVGSNPNCPTGGCFGGQVIQFNITPLDGVVFPASFTLTWTISGTVIPKGTKAGDIVVRHNSAVVPLCPEADPVGACIVSKTIDPSTKIATIEAKGPGTGNGGWGFG